MSADLAAEIVAALGYQEGDAAGYSRVTIHTPRQAEKIVRACLAGSASPQLVEQLRVRIHGLVNRGAEICEAFQTGDMHRVSCERCGYMPDVHLLRDCLAAVAGVPPSPSQELK